jgi:hypothetical protein
VALCGGDVRAALKATLVANAFLEHELERITEMLSAGYGRGRERKPAKRQPKVTRIVVGGDDGATKRTFKMNEREFPFIAAYRIPLGGLGQRLMDMHDWHRARGLKTYQGCRDRRGDDLEYGRWCSLIAIRRGPSLTRSAAR